MAHLTMLINLSAPQEQTPPIPSPSINHDSLQSRVGGGGSTQRAEVSNVVLYSCTPTP